MRSYRTISPLTPEAEASPQGEPLGRAYFLLHLPDPYGRWALPTIVSCGARTFLADAVTEVTHTNAIAWSASANVRVPKGAPLFPRHALFHQSSRVCDRRNNQPRTMQMTIKPIASASSPR